MFLSDKSYDERLAGLMLQAGDDSLQSRIGEFETRSNYRDKCALVAMGVFAALTQSGMRKDCPVDATADESVILADRIMRGCSKIADVTPP